jgi:4'-phosphopantetheinyl transferase
LVSDFLPRLLNKPYLIPPQWPAAQAVPELPDGEVHLWAVDLDAPRETVERLQSVLSSDENERAGRFYFERDRIAFTIARGLLRTLLGGYLGCDPKQLDFAYNRHGKPSLTAGGPPVAGHRDIQFNVSHSGQIALLAFVRERGIGVDVEYMRRNLDYLKVAERVFSVEEQVALAALPAERQMEAFFCGWTRKEAYIKAHGQGVSLPLDQIVVTVSPDEPAQLLAIKGSFDSAARWRMSEVDLGPEYRAAVIVEGSDWRLTCRRWSVSGGLLH